MRRRRTWASVAGRDWTCARPRPAGELRGRARHHRSAAFQRAAHRHDSRREIRPALPLICAGRTRDSSISGPTRQRKRPGKRAVLGMHSTASRLAVHAPPLRPMTAFPSRLKDTDCGKRGARPAGRCDAHEGNLRLTLPASDSQSIVRSARRGLGRRGKSFWRMYDRSFIHLSVKRARTLELRPA